MHLSIYVFSVCMNAFEYLCIQCVCECLCIQCVYECLCIQCVYECVCEFILCGAVSTLVTQSEQGAKLADLSSHALGHISLSLSLFICLSPPSLSLSLSHSPSLSPFLTITHTLSPSLIYSLSLFLSRSSLPHSSPN